MQICGIIAEFNPFHNGHQYIINKTKTDNNCILSVMSGSYVQRGEPAIFSKYLRAEAALHSGVDLVVELPSPWSCSCAQNFSFGAMSLLKNCHIDKLFFGSESGDVEGLRSLAIADRKLKLTENDLKSGKTYAQIRQQKLIDELGTNFESYLSGANNNLGIEYLKAMLDLDCDFEIETIKRTGAEHDSEVATDSICSATYLRDRIKNGEPFKEYVSDSNFELYKNCINDGKYLDYKYFEREIISFLRRLESCDSLPDISEGIDNKLKKELATATSFGDLLTAVKSKRYTLARVRRLLLSAYLQHDKRWFLKEVPYINVLGFTKIGELALRKIAEVSTIPIVISCKPNKPLTKEAEQLLNQECIKTDLYMSLLKSPAACGTDYTNGLIKTGVYKND